jgi:hypothetical protein
LVLSLLVMPPPASAYFQNKELEGALRRNDPKALALLPAKGFRNGAAGFFKAHELYVVPESERAWCHDQLRGPLPPGCYVEFFFQGKGRKGQTSQGEFCGLVGRWYRAPGTGAYLPTPGAFYARAIASDAGEDIDMAIYKERSDCR